MADTALLSLALDNFDSAHTHFHYDPYYAAANENFPVIARFFQSPQREAIVDFYRFARLADDLTDDPTLNPREKQDRLTHIENSLLGTQTGAAEKYAAMLRTTLNQRSIDRQHALHLLQAFRMDVKRHRMKSWSDLLNYCRYVAASYGYFLCDLYGEDRRAVWGPVGTLCAVMQILDILQDLKSDYLKLNRCYLPDDWVNEAGMAYTYLGQKNMNFAVKSVVNRTLDSVDFLLQKSKNAPHVLQSKPLRKYAFISYEIAKNLARELRQKDVLATSVKLSQWQTRIAVGRGLIRYYIS